MKTRIALPALGTLVALAGVAMTPSMSAAQCIPGSAFCAQVDVGVGFGGGIIVGPPVAPPVIIEQAPPPPPPVVIVQQPPPVYVVQQPPPVYVQQPPPVYVQQPPPVYYQQPPPMMMPQMYQPRPSTWGLHADLGGVFGHQIGIGGGDLALRLRPSPQFAVDFGIGAYSGSDYNGDQRTEIPLTVDGLWFLSSTGAWQPYLLAGLGMSVADITHGGSLTDTVGYPLSTSAVYFGGEIGGGIEWRLSQHFALNADVRVFLRQRISDDSNGPEFVETDPSGRPTGRTTDTSWGGRGQVGATYYF